MRFLVILVPVISIAACTSISNKAKNTINKGGEAVGETFTEFFEGVSEGVDKTLDCQISLSDTLLETGLRMGKVDANDPERDGSTNQVTVYLIFNKALKAELSAKAFDKYGNEIGRTWRAIEGEEGSAAYFDFTFDKRTDLEAKSKVLLELKH